MNLKQLIMLALQVTILCTIFGFGLKATFTDLLYLIRRPGLALAISPVSKKQVKAGGQGSYGLGLMVTLAKWRESPPHCRHAGR